MKKNWYAVMCGAEDDWSTGSYDFEEAVGILKRLLAKGYESASIAEIDNHTDNPVCVGEYYPDEDGSLLYKDGVTERYIDTKELEL